MIYKTFLFIVLLFVSNLTQIYAQDKNIVTVISHGVGISENEAVKDALISAIKQVSGAFVFNETIIINDVLTKDNLITISNGMVTDFKLIESNRKADGRFEIKASVSVEKNKSLKNLASHEFDATMKDGKKIFSEIVSQIDRETEGKKFLSVFLRNFPEFFLDADMIGKPILIDNDNERSKIRSPISLKINYKKYKEFSIQASSILKTICSNKGKIVYNSILLPNSNRKAKDLFFNSNVDFNEKDKNAFLIKSAPEYERWMTKDFNEKTHFVLLLNTDYEFNGSTTWDWYHVPKIHIPSKTLSMHIDFLNESRDRLLFSSIVEMAPNIPGLNIASRPMPLSKGNKEALHVVISPFFLAPPYYKNDFIINKEIAVDLENLRLVANINFSFYDSNSNQKTHSYVGEPSVPLAVEKKSSSASSPQARLNPPAIGTNQPRTYAKSSYRVN
jgi:hypothetical protein